MVTIDDMARFSIEAPRYTSYPTAAEFSAATTATDFGTALDEVGRTGQGPIALYVHLPFCRELCHFCGCHALLAWLKPLQNLIATSSLPGAELRLRLMASARAALLAAGYLAIGLDHFALPSDELGGAPAAGTLHRNFQGYTTTASDALVGLGLSAISDLPRGYFQNARTLGGYQTAARAGHLATERGVVRTADDRLRGDVIRTLMCRGRLELGPIEHRFGIRFSETFAPEMVELRRLQEEGLLRLAPASLELTPLGAAFVRNVAKVFDAYRGAPAKAAPRFSMTA